MNNEIPILSAWLKHLNNIPKKKARKETLLDIAGIEHLENNWSFIYLYFFNPKASHGLSRLFVDALLGLIAQKTSQTNSLLSDDFNVQREVPVADEKGNMKRIDLLLQSENDAVIIENKVYASLYNRLDLYWNKPNVPEENKRGVVLSLWSTPPTHHGFVNITHEELAKAVESNLTPYFTSAQPKALILLQDFIQNIYNVTHSMNREELFFYFENREKINRLAEIKSNVVKHIRQAIENKDLMKPLFHEQKWKLSIKTKEKVNYVYYTFDAMPDKVMLTLVYDSLWNFDQKGCRIRMFLELKGDMVKSVDNSQVLRELKDLRIEPQDFYKCNSYWHFKGTEIPFAPEELAEENSIALKIIDAIKESHFYEDGMNIINFMKG